MFDATTSQYKERIIRPENLLSEIETEETKAAT